MRVIITIFSLLNLFVFNLTGQSDSTRVIKGFVYSSHDSEGMPGCNVYIQNTLIGTITDVEGKFELAIPKDDNVTLIISCISEPVFVQTKKNKSYYKIKFDKQKPSTQLRLSAGAFKTSNNNSLRTHLDFGFNFLFSSGFRVKYLSGLSLHYYQYSKPESYIIGLESPLQVQYYIGYKLYLKAGGILGYPITTKTNINKDINDLYFNPVLGIRYRTNSRWGFELMYNYGLTDIGIKDNKITSLAATVTYRLK